MAVIKSFLPKNYKENDEQKQGIAQANPLQPVSSGASASIGAGPAAAPAVQGPSSSGRFVNIQKYVGANNASGDADKVSGFVQNKSDDVKTRITKASDTIRDNINLDNRGFDDATKASYKGLLDKKLSGATLDKADEDKLVSGLGGNYSGADFSGLHSLQNEALSATTSGAQLGNESGRYQLLSKVFGRPGYSQGQSTLDQALIQSDPAAAAKLAATKQAVLSEGAGNEYLKRSEALTAQNATKAKEVSDLRGYLSDTSATGGAASYATPDATAQAAATAANERPALIAQFQEALRGARQYNGQSTSSNRAAVGRAQTLATQLGIPAEHVTGALANSGSYGDPNKFINIPESTGTATWQDKLTPEQKAAYAWLSGQIGAVPLAESGYQSGGDVSFSGKSAETLAQENADRTAKAAAERASTLAAAKAAKEEAARVKEAARLQAIEDAHQDNRRAREAQEEILKSILIPGYMAGNALNQAGKAIEKIR